MRWKVRTNSDIVQYIFRLECQTNSEHAIRIVRAFSDTMTSQDNPDTLQTPQNIFRGGEYVQNTLRTVKRNFRHKSEQIQLLSKPPEGLF